MAKFKRDTFPSKKIDLLKNYQDLFARSNAAYLVKYEGIRVEDLTKFRKNLYQVGSSFKVVKNRLAKLAVKDTVYAPFDKELVEGTAVIFNTQDPISTIKILTKATADFEQLKLVSGIFKEEKAYYPLNDLIKLSKLPPKEELVAQLLYLFNSPITNFARTLNEIPTRLVRTLNQIATKSA